MKLVYGVGYNDRKYPARIGKEKTLEYRYWQKMLMRCYDSSSEFNASYIDCHVSDNFKNYSYFYEWCQKQIGFGNEDWQLDKDFLSNKNKIYSENTCVFIPREINNLLVSNKAKRGDCPIGVSFNKRCGKFEAYYAAYGKRKALGKYEDQESAFMVYKEHKERHIKDVAEKYKGLIDDRVYLALIRIEINITD